jgi:hypothetical protein
LFVIKLEAVAFQRRTDLASIARTMCLLYAMAMDGYGYAKSEASACARLGKAVQGCHFLVEYISVQLKHAACDESPQSHS